MCATFALTCLLSLQQLQVTPMPARVGSELRLEARHPDRSPAVGVAVAVVMPDGESRPLGTTDAAGVVRFTPQRSGAHEFVARVDGVRCLAPIGVGSAPRGWLLALGSVPLGLSLLWLQWRERVRAQRRASSGGGPV